MAEALVSSLIEYLVSIAVEHIGEEVRLFKGVDKDVAKLKTNLEDIQAVLEDAEQKQLNDASVRRWLEKLKNASHRMDDILDNWNTAILEYKIKKEEAEKNASSPTKKVCFPMPFSCLCFTKVGRLTMRRDIALKIKELNEDLDRISKDKEKYNLNTKSVIERPQRQQTTFLIDETKVHGRDKEKSLLTSKLLCESSNYDGSHIDIIPIVGMGGLGKTTLAQLAYNDETIKTHFDKQIWVCVSDPFDEVKIAKAIIEGLGSSAPNSVELNALVQCIHQSIEGKRFLLVLDDVWLEDYYRWETLQEALKNGAIGSKILVTTRKQEVVIMMGAATHQIISLEKLTAEHCWLIFSQLAFMERTTAELVQLEDIGRQIASKSSGLPLVAKVLGSLMRFKKTFSQWEDILSSELWESKDVKVKEIFAPFLLSYYDLPPLEKRCFLYCSIFPQDYIIKRDDLIEMWMSQGYLGQTIDSKRKGRDCFECLAMRSFFQDFEEDAYYGGMQCKMHDIIHDFAQFLTRNEYILMEVDGDEEKIKAIDEGNFHLTFMVRSEAHFPTLGYSAKNLRTLYIESYVNRPYDVGLLFSHLICLRTLNLQRCTLEKLSEDIGLLKHLRYLDLSYNYDLKELPGTLFSLYNLQTLKLRDCYSLRRLPEKIAKLVNLKNLYINLCTFKGLPKGIRKLTGLQTLDMVVVPKEREVYLDLGDLKMLKHLQFQGFLGIKQCANVRSMDEAEKINLKNRRHLVDLSLYFREHKEIYETEEIDSDLETLESLQPHPNLKSLSIWFYEGITLSPTWMMTLINLTSITLGDSVNCKILPPLGKMPSLESLDIVGMRSLEKVGLEFLGITDIDEEDHGKARGEAISSKSSIILFPRLKNLQFSVNGQWKEWEGSCTTTTTNHHVTIMPCLHSLLIYRCRSLETLPEFLQMTPLQNLSIVKSKILQRHCQNVVGKEWCKISHVPIIQFNHKYVKKDGVWIQKDKSGHEDTTSSDSCEE